MKKRNAEPEYDFEITYTTGSEFSLKNTFITDYQILRCTQGEAIISVNSQIRKFATDSNFLLSEGALFKIVEHSDDFKFTIICFSILFLNEILPIIDNKVVESFRYSAPDICNEEQSNLMNLTIDQLILINKDKDYAYRHRIIQNLAVNYLYQVYEVTHRHVDSVVATSSNYVGNIINQFFLLCTEHHTQTRNATDYANMLNISTRYLYKIVNEAVADTPKKMINYYVSGTAKKMLLTTTMSNQQIADLLNFSDQSNFSQFFKRNVGVSPTEFRNIYK